MAKGKKAGNAQKNQGNKNVGTNHQNTQTQTHNQQQINKNQEMTKIMNAVQNMDLNNEDFIDQKSFDQSKAILKNTMEELQHYLKIFEKGQFDKFPKVKVQ